MLISYKISIICSQRPRFIFIKKGTNPFWVSLTPTVKLLLVSEDHCDQEYLVTAEPRHITSPNYPNNYDNNVDCVTQLYSNESQMIQLAFDVFETESSSSCYYDYLEV